MAKCEICGKEETLPLTCSLCGRTFCYEHRLPEAHNCTAASRAQPSYYNRDAGLYGAPRSQRSTLSTSKTEIVHLVIAMVLFFLVYCLGFITYFPSGIDILVLGSGVAISFVSHELAHKFLAQHYGLWSEFRLDPLMSVLSLITAIPIVPIKLIAPGAVVIFAQSGQRATLAHIGKISIAGSLVNIIQAVLCYVLYPYLPILYILAGLNAYLAFFNLIPVFNFDGRKVFAWSKAVWLIFFAGSIGLWLYIGFV